MVLFFLHHAGGSGYAFKKWLPLLQNTYPVIIDLPGHGHRIKEPLLRDYEQVIDFIIGEITDVIDRKEQYMIFGHSMGGILAFCVSQRLSESENGVPCHLFLSACNPPNKSIFCDISKGSMETENVLSVLYDMGGLPRSIFGNEELRSVFFPILQADVELICKCRIEKRIHAPMSIMHGNSDPLSYEAISNWSIYTTVPCRHLCFSGGHFYIHNHYTEICEYINSIANENIS